MWVVLGCVSFHSTQLLVLTCAVQGNKDTMEDAPIGMKGGTKTALLPIWYSEVAIERKEVSQSGLW